MKALFLRAMIEDLDFRADDVSQYLVLDRDTLAKASHATGPSAK